MVIYFNSLHCPFVFDDIPAIVQNPNIRQLATVWREDEQTEMATAVGRPLLRFSLWTNYATGGLDVFGYHVVNIGLHVLAAWTLFGLTRRLLKSPALLERYGQSAWGLALAIALIWVVHPLQTESVTYIVQRAEILGGLFYLLTLYCLVRGATGRRPWAWYIASVLSCLVGMAGKETLATAPLMAVALDRIFLSRSWRRLWERRKWLYVALGCTWIFLGVLIAASSGRANTVGFDLGIAWWRYALTQPYFLCRYLMLSVWPGPLALDYGVYVAQTTSQILPYVLVVAGLIGLTVWGLWRKPVAGFCGLWFFLILGPTSSVVPVTTQTGAEHRMYLPLAGVVALVVVGVDALLTGDQGRRGVRQAWPRIALAVVVIALGWRTIRRNQDYQSVITIWESNLRQWPDNPRTQNALGTVLAESGRLAEAIAHFERALEIDPNHADAHNNLGNALIQTGQTQKAIEHYMESLKLNPNNANAHNNLANALKAVGSYQEAIAHYHRSLELKPDNPEAHNNLANTFRLLGHLQLAIEHYRQAIRIRPEYTKARYNLAQAYAADGQRSQAIANARQALDLARSQGQTALAAEIEAWLSSQQAP